MRLFLLLLLASPLRAEEAPLASPAPLLACLAAAGGGACVGTMAGGCEAEAGPGSEGLCRGAETAFWQARAEAALSLLRDGEGQVQARARRLGWPEPVPTLDALSQGFEAYRRAACDWRAAAWDGIHAGHEQQDCLMRLTAGHALLLEGMLDD